MKINAAVRILSYDNSKENNKSKLLDNDDWFDSLSDKQKAEYIKLHPTSKYVKDGEEPETLDDGDNGDAERVAHLKTQINYLIDDVKEIEDDNDDATAERNHLKSLRDELDRLVPKEDNMETAVVNATIRLVASSIAVKAAVPNKVKQGVMTALQAAGIHKIDRVGDADFMVHATLPEVEKALKPNWTYSSTYKEFTAEGSNYCLGVHCSADVTKIEFIYDGS